MSEDQQTCPKCGDALEEHTDVYDIYPGHVKYLRYLFCLSCNFHEVLEEKDI